MKNWIPVDVATSLVGFGAQNIYRLLNNGTVRGRKVKRRWQVYAPSLRRYDARQAQEDFALERAKDKLLAAVMQDLRQGWADGARAARGTP